MNIIRKHNYTIKTKINDKHLELIPLLDEHLPLLYKWNNDPEVVYWADSGNFEVCTEEDVRGIYSYVSAKAFCFLMVYDGTPIGDCWVQEMNLDHIKEKHPSKKVYRIDMTIGEKDLWGKGIGSAAVKELCDFAFCELSADIMYLIFCDYNERSRKTATKLGFIESCQKEVCDSDRAKLEYFYMMDRDRYIGKVMLEKAGDFIDIRYPEGWGGCAVMHTKEGEFLISVYLDSPNSAAELCMETGAMCEAQKYNYTITHSLCVSRENEKEELKILTPCGICQERLRFWGGGVKVAVSNPKNTVIFKTLDEIGPHYWRGDLT